MSLCAVMYNEYNKTNGVKIFIAVVEILALQVDVGGRKKVLRKRCSKFLVMFIRLETTGLVVSGVRLISVLSVRAVAPFPMLFIA